MFITQKFISAAQQNISPIVKLLVKHAGIPGCFFNIISAVARDWYFWTTWDAVETRRLLSSATIVVGEITITTAVTTTATYQSSVETVISDIDVQLLAGSLSNVSVGHWQIYSYLVSQLYSGGLPIRQSRQLPKARRGAEARNFSVKIVHRQGRGVTA